MHPLPAAPSWSESDFLTLRYRPDLHLLVGRWQRPVSGTELRQGYRALLRAAQETNCPYWQLDLRGRNAPDGPTQQWLTTEFLPRLPEQLGSGVCLGYLLSPMMLAALPSPAEGASRVAFFTEEGPLTAWLTQCQHRSRAALAKAGFMPPPAA
ncbi:MAG: hypothetical protein ACRYG7_54870 [Janthinobacterium lividum]